MQRFVLPLPPPTNDMWTPFCGRGFPQIILSRGGRQYQASARMKLAQQRPRRFGGPVAVRTVFHFPNRRRDSDSGIKPLLDTLQGWCYENDRQVVAGSWLRRIDRAEPRVEFEVFPFDEADGQIQLIPEGW